jgi:hypothetical protein
MVQWRGGLETKETAMSAASEYLDKCLAECPEEMEEILLGELARRVLQKHRPVDRLEVRDRDGLVAYLMPAFLDIEDLSPEERENMLREIDPNEKGMTLEESSVWLEALVQERCRELEEIEAKKGGSVPVESPD